MNTERAKAYARASELRKAIYSIRRHDEDELLEKADKFATAGNMSEAASLFYRIAITNPHFKEAVVMYAACLADMERYSSAISILSFVQDAEGVPQMLAQLKAVKAEEERLAEERREAERQASIVAQAQAPKKSFWENLAEGMLIAADAINAVNSSGATTQSSSSGVTAQSSSGDGG
ncbi:MAG: hypothetical protein LBB56_03770, partial [Chitinispirillales bacterium]|nr:hypothetical protein [Chitinispirillales bacterium]